jgi:xanthosine utilization system XapX-like protein
MNPIFLAALTVTKPTAVGIGIVALVGLYLAFKVAKFVIKILLLAALAALGLAAWWYYAAHHGSF